MTPIRMLLLSGLLVACTGEPEPETQPKPADCVDYFPDGDGDGYGDASAEAERICDSSTTPSGFVDNADDCDDANPEIRPGMPELCDLLGNDENCNGLIDADDPAVIGTVDTYPDEDGDGHGVKGPTEPACLNSPGRSRFTDDCDDNDPTVSPTAGFLEADPLLCMQDADGDGYGTMNPTNPVAEPGTDCDDTNGGRFPDNIEIFADGIDQDCDDADLFALVDDFEDGVVNARIWGSAQGDYEYSTVNANSGQYSLRFNYGGGNLQTVEIDTTACAGGAGIHWSVFVKREGADSGENLRLERYDGTSWTPFLRIQGTSTTDAGFVQYSGVLDDPKAFGPGVKFRIVGTGASLSTEYYYVDDLSIVCAGPDNDGDGFGENNDCDDTSDAHWSDCGTCTDADGDDFGLGCDLGIDCDDGDAGLNPRSPDTFGDGVDTNCDGVDGIGFYDDFEGGAPDPFTWASMAGGYSYDTTYVYAGSYSLNLAMATAESNPIDTTVCPSVSWTYQVKRGPEAPDSNEYLSFDWWNGTSWVNADTLYGDSSIDAGFSERSGVITDPSALSTGFKVRLHVPYGSGSGFDNFYVDEFRLGCTGPDNDGDGYATFDCNDSDPNHWSDCGLCQDLDGDGFGLDCNLGSDCDDTSDLVFPGAPDPLGDGIDADCSGADGEGLLDDFESGSVNPAIWASATGDYAYSTTFANGGSRSLHFGSGGGTFESIGVNTRPCSSVLWSLYVKRDGGPDSGEDLFFERFDGVSWVVVQEVDGGGLTDASFVRYDGAIVDPTAFAANVTFRIRSTGATLTSETYYVDDFQLGCGLGDGDGDGFDGAFDCDDSDPWHWSDCGQCVDSDLDGYGTACDLGSDCDDANPSAYPGAPDPFGDGIDTDCTGADGVGVLDDFDQGTPGAWIATIGGDYSYDPTYFVSPNYSLNLGGGVGTVESIVMDMSGCTAIDWEYMGKRGPEVPDTGDNLVFSYETPTGWVAFDTFAGANVTDPTFSLRSGTITAPNAFWPGFRIRLVSNGSGTSFDDFFIDDLSLVCL